MAIKKIKVGDTSYDINDSRVGTLEITYSELKALRDGGNLVPGRQYRITDFVTTVNMEYTRSAGHAFDVIVVADSNNKLNENARAALHSGDTYFANSKLEAWQLKYCLDNDTTRFEWAASNGKGLIFWMKDEFNNECPYDFKNIQFKRYDVTGFTLIHGQYYSDLSERVETWFNSVKNTLPYRFYRRYSDPKSGQDAVDDGYADLLDVDEEEILASGLTYCIIDDPDWSGDPGLIASFVDGAIDYDWFYTFTNRINNLNSDKSLTKGCYNNVFKSRRLYDNVFLVSTGICHSNTFGEYCSSNTFGGNCYSNTFGDYCSYNTFGSDCSYNTFGGICSSNVLGNQCYSNTFGGHCYYNTFGDQCYSNSLVYNCYSNTFGGNCYSNTFGSGCASNTFGSQCGSNSFGDSCYANTFGNYCSYNTFGGYCNSNTFGGYCSYNTFGGGCYYNTFGEDSSSNTFGNGCSYIKFGNSSTTKSYYNFIIVENGNRNIYLYCSATTSGSQFYRNVKIAQGVNNTSSWKTITDSNVSQAYQTTYQAANSQIINV